MQSGRYEIRWVRRLNRTDRARAVFSIRVALGALLFAAGEYLEARANFARIESAAPKSRGCQQFTGAVRRFATASN